MYACSPRWEDYWIDLSGLREVLESLAPSIVGASPRGVVRVNEGLHFTGGEPFLRYTLLLEAVRTAEEIGYPSVFVETNCFWCINDEVVRERFEELKACGLEGVLVSANPFVVECVPLERIERGLRIAEEVFGRDGLIVYHDVYLSVLRALGVSGTLKFKEYIKRVLSLNPRALELSFHPSILLPMGRLVYSLHRLYEHYPARAFLHTSCLGELTRPWHVHVDCYYNYVPGYCAGISLGDARRIERLIEGVDLDDKPVLRALTENLRSLYELAVRDYGYKELREGYISSCHLCLDLRRHLALKVGGFDELKPLEFYEMVDRARSISMKME